VISRRRALAGMAGALLAACSGRGGRALARSRFAATPVRFSVPHGACDCHTHVFGDPQRYPFFAGRTYTPPPATVSELEGLHAALGIDRVVIVQPSVYGTDNACTLDAARQLGPRARAVAVIDDGTSDAELDEMHVQGARGIRLNLATAGQTDPVVARALFERAAERLEPRGWHIQIYTQLSVIEGLADMVRSAPVPVVFDHFGAASATLGVRQPGFDALLDMVREGSAHVKISAAYRISDQVPGYADVAPLAQALVRANPDRIVWGTDWPHPGPRPPDRPLSVITQPYAIDNGRMLSLLETWVPEPDVRQRILVDTPARLYDF